MKTKTLRSKPKTVAVEKRDLIAAWTALLRVVISLRKMGSFYAIPSGQKELTPERRQEMLEALDNFFTPEVWRQMSRGRVLLEKYFPNEEAEAIGDALEYWQPPRNSGAKQ
jgi:hypothetical protein